jgi:uncharacterized protein (TIRG00374 family)
MRALYQQWRPVLSIVLAVVLLAALALQVHPAEIWDEIKDADLYWIPVILAASLVSDWFRAYRWRQLLAPIYRPSTLLLFLAAQIGSAVNFAVPLRAGDAVKVGIVSRRTGLEPASLVGSLVGEVLSDLVTFSAYAAIGLIFVDKASFLWPLGVLAALAAAGLLAGAHFLQRRGETWAGPPEEDGARRWIGRQLFNFAQGLRSLREPRWMVMVMIGAQGIWLFEALMFYLCGQALGVDLSPAAYLLLVAAANIIGSVPLTQSGFGVFELGVAGLMNALGVPVTQAAAYAVFTHVLLTAPHVVYGPLAAAYLQVTPADVFARPPQDAPER